MLGRVEQAEAGVVTLIAPYGNMKSVSQTEIRTIGGGPNGRFQFITYAMVLPVPYSIYPKVSEKGIVWQVEGRHPRDIENAM